jgi:hypothetical protein
LLERKYNLKLLKEYEIVTQKCLSGNASLSTFMFGRKCDVVPLNGDYSREKNWSKSGFSKQCPLSKSNITTELNTEKIHFQIMLSVAG